MIISNDYTVASIAKFLATRRVEAAHPVETVGATLRKMMSWLKK